MKKLILPRSQSGVALVVTLAMVTLLTFVVVAFFSRAMTNRRIESASGEAVRADLLTKTAAEFIIGDLKAEIAAGSTPVGSGNQTRFYKPTSAANVVPTISRDSDISPNDAVFVNLLKQSSGSFFPSGNGTSAPLIQANSGVTTDTPSANGRSVIASRWDAPQMTVGGNFTADKLPSWILLNRSGISAPQTWSNDFKNYQPGNEKAVIGRFAFNIYDQGGLLDANVVGFPSAISPTAIGKKGTLALAQLSLVPGVGSTANADLFVKNWRNLTTGSSTDNYLAYLGFSKNGTTNLVGNPFFPFGPANGFLKTASSNTTSDNHILGRQDLIRLATKAGTAYGISADALPYLTHFTRELNAPSWGPTQDASAMGGNDGTGSPKPYAYATNADNSAVANRFLPNVRVAALGWRRLTGENALAGEPLVKYRFPLSWLALVQDADPTTPAWDLSTEATQIITTLDARRQAQGEAPLAGTNLQKAAAIVQRAFGLVWDTTNARWNYVGHTGSTTQTTLKTVAQAATENREPNFFELLKAAILSGSLGNASDFESFCVNIGEDANADYQILQIGANIIDQADSDSYPARIAFGFEMDSPPSIITARSGANAPTATAEQKVFAGTEDVPYLQSILATPYRRPAGQPTLDPLAIDAAQNGGRDYINCWAQFVLWKPHQTSASVSSPSNFRIVYSGSFLRMKVATSPQVEYPVGSGIIYGITSANARFTAPTLGAGTSIDFTDSPSNFRSPTLLGGVGVTATDGFSSSQPNGNGGGAGVAQLPRGMWLGETYRPEKLNNPAMGNLLAPPQAWIELQFSNDSRFDLQYQDGAGNWQTYQRFDRVGMGSSTSFRGRGTYGFAFQANGQQGGAPGNRPLGGNGWDKPSHSELDYSALGVAGADPRCQRFGLMAMYIYNFAPTTIPAGEWKNYLKQGWFPNSTGANSPYWALFHPSSTRFVPSWAGGTINNPWGGLNAAVPLTDPTNFWANNPETGGSVYYKDPDEIRRRADGDAANGVRPMQSSNAASFVPNTQDLGLVLNRPFRSVGELSYVFRDAPYKSLDFFSANSADGALLDIFSVDEQPSVVAGKLNLNTRNAIALQSVLVASSREDGTATNILSVSEAQAIANNLIANTSSPIITATTGPLQNPADLAKRISAILPVASTANAAIKARREVIVRALGGAGQTRTWNLLVDVIAQSGRFATNATSNAQFIAEGEKRYWLHVAIDRYTGQVIDQQLETVLE
jgi:Tfp pilus assembly protein PilX